ncbi:type IV toxin-antitoxin system AbiEi family antitoxin domain-containing protein [Methylibium petroleiphilum]|uniref:type IV toxin-antitoxin system AbiEi family antitoxin domain-containing protein n=1 Tax=Methylibium petroleiphilum TaxID=105560 RepID=UPI0023532817|nr:type IV toxin-antitoxin system AbiEi family antitoxin [Methylibium petroleiphilum]
MKPTGLSATSREQLSTLLRDSPSVLTAGQAASALGMTHTAAARRLAAWSRAGWLARVRRGAYVPVPIESASADVALDDPWSVAGAMFAPCYIGGWSAAEHWGLTEQIFRSLCVMTTQRPRNRKPVLRKARFELHTVPEAHFIGLKAIWRGSTRVQVSDPARTLIDMLANPALAGGIRHLVEMLGSLLHDQPREAAKLGAYAVKLGIGSVFKRLGFLLQRDHPDQAALIALCRQNLSAGYARLDPALPADRLATAWRVWVPATEVREVQT